MTLALDPSAHSSLRPFPFGRLVRWLLTAGVVTAWLFLLLALLLPQDLQQRNRGYLALCVIVFFMRVFWFHAGISLAVATLLAVLLRRWKTAFAGCAAAIICLAPTFVAMSRTTVPPSADAGAASLRVMSMNLYFNNRNSAAILHEIDAQNADLLLLVEYSHLHDALLPAALAERYPYNAVVARSGRSGVAIFSRLPFVEPPRDIDLTAGEGPQLRTVLDVNGQHVAFYGLHLVSPSPRRSTIMKNRLQVEALTRMVRDEKLPVILAGDFNFTPTTANAQALRNAGLRDTHELVGSGRGSTWPQHRILRQLPGVRIDHIYISGGITCTAASVGRNIGSDHLPVIADVVVHVRRVRA